uniref:Uncharacterized protein n=2 Tax=unclassified Caudoviricetes TaxID=2788787 RepID=A0A8S5Q6X6_9CAUD|nr:MAG TPA: hypothetical protein [Siphoviridae sp. ctAvK3]DAE15118.1 MAG TPA: hypothetical protein [Siphoviridae sp. ctdVv30]
MVSCVRSMIVALIQAASLFRPHFTYHIAELSKNA